MSKKTPESMPPQEPVQQPGPPQENRLAKKGLFASKEFREAEAKEENPVEVVEAQGEGNKGMREAIEAARAAIEAAAVGENQPVEEKRPDLPTEVSPENPMPPTQAEVSVNKPSPAPDLPAGEEGQGGEGGSLTGEEYDALLARAKKRGEVNGTEQPSAPEATKSVPPRSRPLPPRFKPTVAKEGSAPKEGEAPIPAEQVSVDAKVETPKQPEKDAEKPSKARYRFGGGSLRPSSDIPDEVAPFDISPGNVRRIVKGLAVEDEVGRAGEPSGAPESGPAVAPENDEQILKLKENLAGSSQEMVGKWLGIGKMSPERMASIDASYTEMQKAAYGLTGESLDKRMRLEAVEEARRNGKKVISRKEFFSQENVAKAEKDETKRRIGAGVRVSWNSLSEDEKRRRILESGNIKEASKKYGKDLEARRQELKGGGIDLPVDVYYNLLSRGIEPQNLVKKGIFSKKIVMAYSHNNPEEKNTPPFFKGDLNTFKAWAEGEKHNLMMDIRRDAGLKMGKEHEIGKQAWMNRKVNKLIDISADIVHSGVAPEVAASAATREPFKEAMAVEKFENEVKVLSDAEVKTKGEEVEREYKERISKMEKIVDDEACVAILSGLGLTPKEVTSFKKSVKAGAGDRLGKIPVRFWDSFMQQHREIKKEHDMRAKIIGARNKIIRQKEMEKNIAAVREKLATVGQKSAAA